MLKDKPHPNHYIPVKSPAGIHFQYFQTPVLHFLAEYSHLFFRKNKEQRRGRDHNFKGLTKIGNCKKNEGNFLPFMRK